MAAFLSNMSAVLPAALWAGRVLLLLAAVWVLLRCGLSLFGQREEPEVWGFISLSNGARYDLTHWENMIGRMRSADVRVNFPSVSRCHAALCRNDQGQWTVYPVNRSSGVLLNGERKLESAPVKALAYYMTARPNTYVASGGYVRRQLDAVFSCHKTQFPDGSADAKAIALYLKIRAADFGLRSLKGKAEGFRALSSLQMHCMPEAGL